MNLPVRFLRTTDQDVARAVVLGIQKGGTGKSTLTAELGMEAARLGAKVLMVDFDPNWNLTQSIIGYNPIPDDPNTSADLTIGDLIESGAEGSAADAILMAPGLWQVDESLPWASGGALTPGGVLTFIPGYPSLQGVVDNRNVPAAERRLRKVLRGVSSRFDLVLIDTGPRADQSVQTAMLAAGTVLAPLQPESGPVDGLNEHVQFIEAFADAWDHAVRFAGAICTRYDSRNSVAHLGHLNEARTKLATYVPTVPEVANQISLDGDGVASFAGTTGLVWDEVVPQSTVIVNTHSDRAPISTNLKPQVTRPSGRREARSRVMPLVSLHARIALKLLQLTEAPRLPEIAEALRNDPIPGVFDPAAEDDGRVPVVQ